MVKNQNPDLNTKHRTHWSHEGLREVARQKNPLISDLSQMLWQKKNLYVLFSRLYTKPKWLIVGILLKLNKQNGLKQAKSMAKI